MESFGCRERKFACPHIVIVLRNAVLGQTGTTFSTLERVLAHVLGGFGFVSQIIPDSAVKEKMGKHHIQDAKLF
jgi:hypothetical protein